MDAMQMLAAAGGFSQPRSMITPAWTGDQIQAFTSAAFGPAPSPHQMIEKMAPLPPIELSRAMGMNPPPTMATPIGGLLIPMQIHSQRGR